MEFAEGLAQSAQLEAIRSACVTISYAQYFYDEGPIGGALFRRRLRHFEKRFVKKLLTLRPTPAAPSRVLPHAVFAGGAVA
jgi:hypothetical protein